jgi:hypothetical protein
MKSGTYKEGGGSYAKADLDQRGHLGPKVCLSLVCISRDCGILG